jgi:hypothetical protein
VRATERTNAKRIALHSTWYKPVSVLTAHTSGLVRRHKQLEIKIKNTLLDHRVYGSVSLPPSHLSRRATKLLSKKKNIYIYISIDTVLTLKEFTCGQNKKIYIFFTSKNCNSCWISVLLAAAKQRWCQHVSRSWLVTARYAYIRGGTFKSAVLNRGVHGPPGGTRSPTRGHGRYYFI